MSSEDLRKSLISFFQVCVYSGSVSLSEVYVYTCLYMYTYSYTHTHTHIYILVKKKKTNAFKCYYVYPYDYLDCIVGGPKKVVAKTSDRLVISCRYCLLKPYYIDAHSCPSQFYNFFPSIFAIFISTDL